MFRVSHLTHKNISILEKDVVTQKTVTIHIYTRITSQIIIRVHEYIKNIVKKEEEKKIQRHNTHKSVTPINSHITPQTLPASYQ